MTAKQKVVLQNGKKIEIKLLNLTTWGKRVIDLILYFKEKNSWETILVYNEEKICILWVWTAARKKRHVAWQPMLLRVVKGLDRSLTNVFKNIFDLF